jgi:hypothetical protein
MKRLVIEMNALAIRSDVWTILCYETIALNEEQSSVMDSIKTRGEFFWVVTPWSAVVRAGTPETVVSYGITTRRPNSEDRDLDLHRRVRKISKYYPIFISRIASGKSNGEYDENAASYTVLAGMVQINVWPYVLGWRLTSLLYERASLWMNSFWWCAVQNVSSLGLFAHYSLWKHLMAFL